MNRIVGLWRIISVILRELGLPITVSVERQVPGNRPEELFLKKRVAIREKSHSMQGGVLDGYLTAERARGKTGGVFIYW